MQQVHTINVKVIPNSKRTELVSIEDNEYIIKISSVADKGKANKELIDFLSDYFHCCKKDIIIIKGSLSRNKTIRILTSN